MYLTRLPPNYHKHLAREFERFNKANKKLEYFVVQDYIDKVRSKCWYDPDSHEDYYINDFRDSILKYKMKF